MYMMTELRVTELLTKPVTEQGSTLWEPVLGAWSRNHVPCSLIHKADYKAWILRSPLGLDTEGVTLIVEAT